MGLSGGITVSVQQRGVWLGTVEALITSGWSWKTRRFSEERLSRESTKFQIEGKYVILGGGEVLLGHACLKDKTPEGRK